MHLSSGGVEWESGGKLTRGLEVQSNVVVKLLLFSSQLGGDVLALCGLGSELKDGGLELENLVLYLAVLKGSRLVTCCGLDGGVEGFGLGIVGNIVDGSKEVNIGCVDIGEVVDVQSAVSGQNIDGFLLSVAGSSA